MDKGEHLSLNDGQRQFFEINGYLSLDAITTLEEVQSIQQAYDMLLALHTSQASTYQGRLAPIDEALKHEKRVLLTNPQRYHRAFAGTLFESNALSIARQVVGNEAKLREAYLLYKPARFGTETPWHQEEAYLPAERTYNLITFWLALQDTWEESGSMHFLPGSQRLEVLPHYQWESGDSNIVLAVDPALFDEARAVACPLPAGGATMHTSRTLHYASPNVSNMPRRAFILDIEYPRAMGAKEEADGRAK